MENRLRSVICSNVTPECRAKLEALTEFSRQFHGDIAGMVLETGIIECWERYKNNPKHSAEIKAWEKEHGK